MGLRRIGSPFTPVRPLAGTWGFDLGENGVAARNLWIVLDAETVIGGVVGRLCACSVGWRYGRRCSAVAAADAASGSAKLSSGS